MCRCVSVAAASTKCAARTHMCCSSLCTATPPATAEARGWGAYVSLNASENSKRLAKRLCEAAELFGQKVRRYAPGQPWWVQNLAMCRDTKCPAVLTENLFQDNRADVDYLLSAEGRTALADLHVQGIADYIREL